MYEQLLVHFFGDFLIQNVHVGVRKKEKSKTGLLYCIYHCITYSLCFLLITNWKACILIGISHFILDRWHLIDRFLRLKNNTDCLTNFGYPESYPFPLAVWLNILQDNMIHLICNYLIIRFIC